MAFTQGIVFFVFIAVATPVSAEPKLNLGERREPDLSSPRIQIPDIGIQYEKRNLGELEGDAERDMEFDNDIASDDKSPKLPTANEARSVYEKQINTVASEAEKAGDRSLSQRPRFSINPVFQYYSLQTWQQSTLRCCPRSWNYQCRSTNTRLPCFRQYYGSTMEWCCPIWPSVYIRRCACSQCAVLTSTCANEGRCRSRYSRRSFLAVCYRNHQWGYLRYLNRYLPSSCYCRI